MTGRRVLLQFLPFGACHMPSLGLSLLQAGLARVGVDCALHYHTLDFARRIGARQYSRISADHPTRFLGEWVFMPALWGRPSARREEQYWRSAFPAAGPGAFDPNDPPLVLREASEAEARRTLARLQDEAVRYLDEYVDGVDWNDYAIVGFSSTFQQGMASLALARRIKRRAPQVTVVFGGGNCEAEMGAALLRNYDFVDYVFSGEADTTFPRFVVRHLEGQVDGTPEPGILRRRSGEVERAAAWVAPVQDLDALPYPDFGDFFGQLTPDVRVDVLEIPFETARGCWWGEKHHCTFCGLNGGTMGYRSKSPQRALDEILWLHRRYGDRTTRYKAVDNILDTRYFKSLVPALERLPPDARVFFETKSNLKQEQIEALARARIVEIQPGIESLSTEVLGLMRKGCTLLQNVQTLKWCSAAGVTPHWNVIYGFPGETAATYSEMTRLIPLLAHLPAPLGSGPVRLDRFSPYHQDPAAWGLRDVRPHPLYRQFHRFADAEVADLAYYFEYDCDYEDDMRYVAPLREAVRRWTRPGPHGVRSALVGFVRDEEILIWDTREVARAEWVSLRGPAREALLRFEKARPLPDNSPALAEAVEQLIDHGYLIREGDRFLSLIVLRHDAEGPRIPAGLVHALPVPVRSSAGAVG